MDRVTRMLAAQERMNKAHNVSPEFQKMVNDLFKSPVISPPISLKRSDDQKRDAQVDQSQLE